MTFSIRPAREEDAASIIEVLNPLILAGNYTIMVEPLTLAEQIDFMRRFPERGVFHIAMDNHSQRIVGLQDVVPLSTETAFRHVGVISTFVSLTAQGQGIGRMLSEATFGAAKALGFLKLSATVRADNPSAVAFYLSQGFTVIGTAQKHAQVQGQYLDEILLEKFLD